MCVSLVMGEEDEELQSWGWNDLSSYSSSLSDSEQEQQIPSSLQTGLMSRRSLRLDDGLLDRSLLRSSASFSVGGASWRSRARHSWQHSASCSESLLVSSPRKAVAQSLHNSSLHSVASDASLMSSLLDESSIQESTLVETFWGLDQDADPKESTIVANEISSLIGSDSCCAKHPVQTVSSVCCKDCDCQSAPKTNMETSTVYCRDRRSRTDVLQLWLNSSLLFVRRAAARCMPVLQLTWLPSRSQPNRHGARSGNCGVMALKEPKLKELHPVGSLCCSAGDMFRQIGRRWSGMSSGFHLGRLFIVLLLLLFFNFNMADVPGLSSVHSFMSSQSQSAEGIVEVLVQSPPPSAEMPPQEVPSAAPPAVVVLDSERLVQMEQSLRALWEEMEAAERRAEQSHSELLQLYADLHQQASRSHHSRYDAELWTRGLMEQQLSLLRRRLGEERRQMEQMRQQDLLVLKTQMSRLEQLELQLQQVVARSQELQWTHEAGTAHPAVRSPTPSAMVDKESQDALQADVSRLVAALVDVRRDVDGLSGCQDSCQQLDRTQHTPPSQMSEQILVLIREEVRALIYGNQLTQDGDSILPESLLQWLSQQFISEANLQEALSSLEFSILQNINQRLQQLHGADTVREAVLDTAGNAVTKEKVHVMVTEALRLFSQDRTGLADYALESGGGSILSTRCSETYETKAALLSLFGVPLWYFSQSPRAVIQPDVHPGNCWAFRGSKGFLVIQLSMRILPTSVTMEHIPKSLAPSRTLHSAPRDFSVYGLRDEHQEKGKLLGNYTYDEDGEDLQTFTISEENNEVFQIIEVQVLSNWGHPEYTCMYRFRVHGTPSDV
ncbi:SUN domain-containing protein 1-like isoform X2 [Girardinichthys multiradiatus]|uniref:SUN domain-containing protein 1-like isoform X2 n=1 Tax=Girardinichthys multiradiatus TaxID=208333 RepID=UPI001FAC81AA|nr:SUN domain-containing protein 1-like isoform X2 [Girardinichthys multiradiatus]